MREPEVRLERARQTSEYYEGLYNHERRVTSSLLTVVETLGHRISELIKENAGLQRRVETAETALYEIESAKVQAEE